MMGHGERRAIMYAAISGAIILVLAILYGTTGCATVADWIDGKPDVQVHPESRAGEWWGYIHSAELRLGMRFKGKGEVWFKEGEKRPGQGYCLFFKNMTPSPQNNFGYAWGGTSAANDTRLAITPSGAVQGRSGLHEAARWVLNANGITGSSRQDPIMKAKGCW